MKLKAPENFGNIAHNDIEYTIDKNGVVDVPAEIAHHFTPFGFQEFKEDEKKSSKKIEK